MSDSYCFLRRNRIHARVALWSGELVLVTRGLRDFQELTDLETYRFLEIQRTIARDQFNAARDEQEEMEGMRDWS